LALPAGIDCRTDIEQPDRYEVYFGVNDFRINVARLDVPTGISEGAIETTN
jgi:hypothetical protein